MQALACCQGHATAAAQGTLPGDAGSCRQQACLGAVGALDLQLVLGGSGAGPCAAGLGLQACAHHADLVHHHQGSAGGAGHPLPSLHAPLCRSGCGLFVKQDHLQELFQQLMPSLAEHRLQNSWLLLQAQPCESDAKDRPWTGARHLDGTWLQVLASKALLTFEGEEKRSHRRMQQEQQSMCPHGMTIRSVDSMSWQIGHASPLPCR